MKAGWELLTYLDDYISASQWWGSTSRGLALQVFTLRMEVMDALPMVEDCRLISHHHKGRIALEVLIVPGFIQEYK